MLPLLLRDSSRRTPLHLATSRGLIDVFKSLVEAISKDDFIEDRPDGNGDTAFWIALKAGLDGIL